MHHDAGRGSDPQSEQQTSLALKDPHQESDTPVIYGAPEWAGTSHVGIFAGVDFEPQPDGTLRCPTNHPLYPQERRAEQDGTVRIVYAARIRDCRACRLRVQCLAHGKETKRDRRVSAVLRPIEGPPPPPESAASPVPATQPILWGDWSRCQTRRRLDEPFAHTNRHDHASTSHSPSTRCSTARPIDTAGTQTCSADVGAASGTQRLWRIRASCETSPLRYSNCLRPGHRSSLSLWHRHQARRTGTVSASRRAFFSCYARGFFHPILFHPVIMKYFIFDFNILMLTNISNKSIFTKF